MWHLSASPIKKQHFILIHSELKKTVLAVRSIVPGGFEGEESGEGKSLEDKKQIVEVRETSSIYIYTHYLR